MARRVCWLVVAALLAAGAGTGTGAPRQTGRRTAGVIIDLDTTGGFTGIGPGGVTIAADGSARASGIGGGNRHASRCQTRLTDAERQVLLVALQLATRQPWPATFAPPGDMGCCDRRKWVLRLRETADTGGMREFTTTWFDGNEGNLPRELVRIKDIAAAARTRAFAACAR